MENQDKFLGRNISQADAIKKAKLSLADQGQVSHDTFHHEELMDQMVKTIEFTQMHRKIRSVLLLRLIHGYTIERMQIYLFLHGHMTGNSRDELLSLEAEGKRLILETLKTHSMQEIIGTINAKPSIITGLRNELTKPELGLS